MKNKAEHNTRIKIRSMVAYMLNTDDKIVIDNYTNTIMDIVLSAFEDVAREQREADLKLYKKATDVRLSIIAKAIVMELNESPLVTESLTKQKE